MHEERRVMLAANWHGREDIRLEQLAEPDNPTGEDVLIEVSWCDHRSYRFYF